MPVQQHGDEIGTASENRKSAALENMKIRQEEIEKELETLKKISHTTATHKAILYIHQVRLYSRNGIHKH